MTFDFLAGALLVTLATCIGAASTLFIKNLCGVRYSIILAFSAGVMAFTAAEMFGQAFEQIDLFSVVISFALGFASIMIMEKTLPHIHYQIKKTELANSKKKVALIVGAIAIHNIPEGFAIAAAFAGSVPLGWFTAISMAIQDVPEGAMISTPLICYGLKKSRAVGLGMLSGITEGVAAVLGYFILSFVLDLVPLALAFSSGAMVYVVLVEIMPDVLRENAKLGSLSFVVGMVIAFLLAGFFS